MKKNFCYFIITFCLFIIAGCSSVSPYAYGTSWLIRENDIPQYHSKFDLFYIGKAPNDYGKSHDVQFNWAKTHTNDIFGKKVRVFAPEITNPNVENVTNALNYYLDNFHKPGHPFILLSEGRGADLLYKAMKKAHNLTVKNGFIAAYLPDMTPKTKEQIADDFYWENIKAATNANDYGVIVTWTSCINNEKMNFPKNKQDKKNIYNINPLNWKTDSTLGTKKESIKAIFYMPPYKNLYWRKVEEPNFCQAYINNEQGVLRITCETKLLHVVNGRFNKNCISIFAGNIAKNANKRTENLINDRRWGK